MKSVRGLKIPSESENSRYLWQDTGILEKNNKIFYGFIITQGAVLSRGIRKKNGKKKVIQEYTISLSHKPACLSKIRKSAEDSGMTPKGETSDRGVSLFDF